MNKYIVPLPIGLLLLSTSFTGLSRKKTELITDESLINEVIINDIVDQEQPVRDSLHGSSGEIGWAQSFKPSLTTLTRVELLIQAVHKSIKLRHS